MKSKNIPIRKCIGCGARKTKAEFVMVVRSAKCETVKSFRVLNGNEKKEGRSAYICKSMDCLNKARKAKRLEKTFKGKIENIIYETLEKMVSENE